MGWLKKILVVDDDCSNRTLLTELMELLGFQARAAADGSEALDKLQGGFDLVLLDLMMPIMNGFEVLKHMRTHASYRDIPVIIVSSMDERDTRLQAIEAGANDFVSKPVDRLELSLRVESLLKLKEAQDALKRNEAQLERIVALRTAQLRESEARFRTVADFTYDWQYWIDPDGGFLYVSPSCERITGYTADEFINDPGLLRKIIHRDDGEVADVLFRNGCDSRLQPIDFRIISKSGQTLWISNLCKSVYGDDGEWLGIRGSNRDITQQKSMEAELKSSRELFRLVLDTLPVGIAYLDLQQRINFVNESFKRWLNGHHENLIGVQFRELLKEDFAVISPHLEKSFCGETVTCETSLRKRNGDKRMVSAFFAPHLGSNGEALGAVSVISDITERKRFQEKLLRIGAAVDGSSDAIVMASPQGEHFYQNRTFSNLFGYKPKDLRGPLGPLLAFTDHRVGGEIFDTIRQGKKWLGEVDMVTKDGRCLPVHLKADAICDNQGEVSTLLGIITDVSEHKEVQKTLRNRTDDLAESRNRFRSLFDAAQDCIFVKDKHLRYTEINPAMAAIFGVSPSDFIGKTDAEIFGKEIFDHSSSIENRVLSGQSIENSEVISSASQQIVWNIARFPLKDSYDRVIGICGIAREVEQPRSTSAESFFDSSEKSSLSHVMRATLAKAEIARASHATVLLTGETGSGKDHLAKYIHDHSRFNTGPFLSINCAAIPTELAESELFGHEAGAFTGATRRKRGLMQMAEGGTLLLNEIGELSVVLQAKLLTFLDTMSFTPVGGEKTVTVNTRLMVATSRDLEAEIRQGGFRKDLYYRLNVLPIEIPPLRSRSEDIPLLIRDILAGLSEKSPLDGGLSIDDTAITVLCEYSWPGNVRELKNVLERAVILSKGNHIKIQHISLGNGKQRQPNGQPCKNPVECSLHNVVEDKQRSLIMAALENFNGNKQRASGYLGISRYALARLVRRLGIEMPPCNKADPSIKRANRRRNGKTESADRL